MSNEIQAQKKVNELVDFFDSKIQKSNNYEEKLNSSSSAEDSCYETCESSFGSLSFDNLTSIVNIFILI